MNRPRAVGVIWSLLVIEEASCCHDALLYSLQTWNILLVSVFCVCILSIFLCPLSSLNELFQNEMNLQNTYDPTDFHT